MVLFIAGVAVGVITTLLSIAVLSSGSCLSRPTPSGYKSEVPLSIRRIAHPQGVR